MSKTTENGKVVLVTGAARRIGAALTQRFHAAGYKLILHCNHSTTEAEALADKLNVERPGSAHVLQLNLTRTEDFALFGQQCLTLFGRIDVVVNNASAFYPTSTETVTAEEFDDLMAVNVKAPFFLATTFRSLIGTGSIINIVDIFGEQPLDGFSAYSISKAALAMATRSLAMEFAPEVRVNGVSPGAILWPENTNMDEGELSMKAIEEIIARIPMGRIGEPDDIADAALFLAESDYITGQILSVDGGSMIRS